MSEVVKLTDRLWVRRSEHWENYYLYCPGCKELHGFCTKAPQPPESTYINPVWSFNGNAESPTFTPSLLHKRHTSDYPGCKPHCHIIVTDGRIQFCADCEHELAGQTIDLTTIADKVPADYMIT